MAANRPNLTATSRRRVLAAAAFPVLALLASRAAAQDSVSPMQAHLQSLILSAELARRGREAADAGLMIAAVELRLSAPNAEPADDGDPYGAKALLADAARFAQGDEGRLALIGQLARGLDDTLRSAPPARYRYTTLPAELGPSGGRNAWQVRCRREVRMCATASIYPANRGGAGPNPRGARFEMAILDPRQRIIRQEVSPEGRSISLEWTPLEDGVHRAVVTNFDPRPALVFCCYPSFLPG